MGLNSRYEIRVKGILDGRWTSWFDDLQVTSDALHGLLTKVRDLGLSLISIRHLDSDLPSRVAVRGCHLTPTPRTPPAIRHLARPGQVPPARPAS